MKRMMRKLSRDERGQNTVEYLLMVAIVGGVILVLGKMFAPQIGALFKQVMGQISGAATSAGTPGNG